MTTPMVVVSTGNSIESLERLPVLAGQLRRKEALVLLPHEIVTTHPGPPKRTLTLPKAPPFEIVICNAGPTGTPGNAGHLSNRGQTLVIRSADGTPLTTLKRGQSATIRLDDRPYRRKLRRIGGSDRLWRALRGGR